MAEVVWTKPALADLDAIADYIALNKPDAARQLIQRASKHVEHLAQHPKSDSRPQELKGWRYRQVVEPPCHIFHPIDGDRVYPYVMRGEQLLRSQHLSSRDRKTGK